MGRRVVCQTLQHNHDRFSEQSISRKTVKQATDGRIEPTLWASYRELFVFEEHTYGPSEGRRAKVLTTVARTGSL
jgi:hypothetical protein